jgi:stage II sporulation protein D
MAAWRRLSIRQVFVLRALLILCGGLCLPLGGPLRAQTFELTSADRLAQLYSSQLVFDGHGIPLIRLGLAEGLRSLTITPQGALRVMPQGPGGPVIELPARQRYHIALTNGAAGTYQHALVLERVEGDASADALSALRDRWRERSVGETDWLDVGSVFALSGRMFDTRQFLLTTPPSADLKAVERERDRLEKIHGVEVGIHSELERYPSADLTLTSDDLPVKVSHRDLLWLDASDAAITIEGLPDSPSPQTLRGHLILAPDRQGALSVILAAPIEDILRGVVPAETYATAPAAALQVQAIAARGTILASLGARHLADPYHLCNKQHCQVYKGPDAATPATDLAITQTRGQVLMHDRRIAETFYIWFQSARPYLTNRADTAAASTPPLPTDEALTARLAAAPKDTWCATSSFPSSKHSHWEQTLSISEANALIATHHDIGSLRDVRVITRSGGGRVIRLELVGAKGTVTVERELAIRRLFGGLRSALFTLTISRDAKGNPTSLTFQGAGFGHGVGMCQTGAMGMAQAGRAAPQIIQHYYPSTALQTLW